MTKRMLIDDTHAEETRVVIVDNNKLEDVEFETAHRKQIKSNVYLGKIIRVEPSLQAAFVDYGGNRHGFLAFGEIHPDYYNLSEKEMAEIDKEVDDVIEAKKRSRQEIKEELKPEKVEIVEAKLEENTEEPKSETSVAKAVDEAVATAEETITNTEENPEQKKNFKKRRLMKKSFKKKDKDSELKVLTENSGLEDDVIKAEPEAIADYANGNTSQTKNVMSEEDVDDDEEDDDDDDFELTKRLLKVRKLYHRHSIQEVIKEGQTVLVQVVKEERGGKGAALTTYLSLAGRYCVLMPNRIKSGGVSRKITNANDRKRLKEIIRELPLTSDMSMIVRTAGEDKTKQEIVRDYNYLMRSWNLIRIEALKNKPPFLVHEEGNLIKRALRDMYTKDIYEVIIDGDEAYRAARDFIKILSPQNLKKIKYTKKGDIPLFQRYQVESQLDKLHDANVQLESGGYLVINPTEALVAIDVNSGRATKEKDIEETALKTNLEAADEIARQLRLRNLAGLVVIDFIDMDENKNNAAVEKRVKEAMKNDRARIQISKMSQFGLLEISRQRMHSSFFESSYATCPHCQGKGMIRTVESSAMLVLRDIEEECTKNRSMRLNIFLPTDVAIYLLNHKRNDIAELEKRYTISIIISADDSIKNINNYRMDRVKNIKPIEPKVEEKIIKEIGEVEVAEKIQEIEPVKADEVVKDADKPEGNRRFNNNKHHRRDNRDNRNNKFQRRDNREHGGRDNRPPRNHEERLAQPKEKKEAVILYNSHGGTTPAPDDKKEGKTGWWKKLIG